MSSRNADSKSSGPRRPRSDGEGRKTSPGHRPPRPAQPDGRKSDGRKPEGRGQEGRRSGGNAPARNPRSPRDDRDNRPDRFRRGDGPRAERREEDAPRRQFARQGRQEPFRPISRQVWPAGASLFPRLTDEARDILSRLPEALRGVWPLNAAHRRSLPEDVERLSRLLTTERAGLSKPYWSSPAAISAYLYYFLPWNLVRLTRLLADLPLPDPRGVAPQGGEALLVDVGSGPLTLPLALWLAKPEWRSAPVRVLALDTSTQPLELGKSLMETLGALTNQPVWPVRTARAPLEHAARQAAPLLGANRARPWLVSAANVLNELRFGKKTSRGIGAIDEEDEFDSLDTGDEVDPAIPDEGRPEGCREDRLDSFLESLSPLFTSGGEAADNVTGPSLLFVEPGTRLGGTTIMRLRQLAVDGGLTALAPCPHQESCPLLHGQGGRTWCHFTFGSEGAPEWLENLSYEAGLGKSGLSLSPLLLSATPPVQAGRPGSEPARVLSAPFAVPGLTGRARYACSGKGLLLLEDAEGLASGDLLNLTVPAGSQRDRKSGALVVRAPRPEGQREEARPPRRAETAREGQDDRRRETTRRNPDSRPDRAQRREGAGQPRRAGRPGGDAPSRSRKK